MRRSSEHDGLITIGVAAPIMSHQPLMTPMLPHAVMSMPSCRQIEGLGFRIMLTSAISNAQCCSIK